MLELFYQIIAPQYLSGKEDMGDRVQQGRIAQEKVSKSGACEIYACREERLAFLFSDHIEELEFDEKDRVLGSRGKFRGGF